MITTCPTCGCNIYMASHASLVDCINALEQNDILSLQNKRRVWKKARDYIVDVEAENKKLRAELQKIYEQKGD